MTLTYHTPLSPDVQRSFGIDDPQPLAMADQVRFSELDVLNHVNNAVYMTWFERLRVRYTQEWGISRYDGGVDNPRIVIRSGTIHYIEEMRQDEDYIVTCRCVAFRTNSYTLAQQLWADGRLRATFDCVLVNLDQNGASKRPLSEAVRARFQSVDGARADAV